MLLTPNPTPNHIVWSPIPGSSQELALAAPCHHVLYTGARGPGKTDCQLMRFRMNVGIGYGPMWRGIIFDREYKMLDDLVSKSKRWFNAFNDGAQFLTAKSDYKWVWPTGEELLIRSIMDPEDYWLYHGQEFPFIGWNELCKYPTSACYDRMMSCNRSSYTQKDWPVDGDGKQIPMPNMPLIVFSTTNPYGPGHNWVKRRFITPAPYGHIVRKHIDIFNPQTQKDETVEKTQVALFGSWRENIYLDPAYIAELVSMDDPNIRRAWELGDWDIVAGGAFDDCWRSPVHVVNRFYIPEGVYVDRVMDWGSSQPAWIGWFAEADGEEFELEDGTKFCPQPGSLVLVHELYMCKEIGTNKGLKTPATDLAILIKNTEQELLECGWITEIPAPGPADNQIRNVNDQGTDTIEKLMADQGVIWEASDKARGTRKVGMQLMRDRMMASVRGEGAGYYVMDHCRSTIDILPSLPRDPDEMDDVDTTSEDHVWDGHRFRILKGNNRVVRELNIKFAT